MVSSASIVLPAADCSKCSKSIGFGFGKSQISLLSPTSIFNTQTVL